MLMLVLMLELVLELVLVPVALELTLQSSRIRTRISQITTRPPQALPVERPARVWGILWTHRALVQALQGQPARETEIGSAVVSGRTRIETGTGTETGRGTEKEKEKEKEKEIGIEKGNENAGVIPPAAHSSPRLRPSLPSRHKPAGLRTRARARARARARIKLWQARNADVKTDPRRIGIGTGTGIGIETGTGIGTVNPLARGRHRGNPRAHLIFGPARKR